ncbi:MAG: methylmalonyl Co-A mutase-associated GTPase MeaB [Gammaproteobacteria bacterium]
MTRADSGIAALRAGDRRALARAITLLESTRAEHRRAAEKLLRRVMPHSGGAIRLGISGAPGVGKSTFIEAFGAHAIARGHRVAVLSIDPTSRVSGGSILGDKTRMATLAANPNAFIRPSPAGGALGGVARRTQEALLVCEAANYDLIIVESTGVGQSETLVAAMTDIFLLLLPPAGGDALQGIKRGIMELADIVVVNKHDGELAKHAAVTAAGIGGALGMMRPRMAGWRTPVVRVSAIENTGIGTVREKIDAYCKLLNANGALQKRRRAQAREWLWNETREALLAELKKDPAVDAAFARLLMQVGDGKLPASVAARELVAMFMRTAA